MTEQEILFFSKSCTIQKTSLSEIHTKQPRENSLGKLIGWKPPSFLTALLVGSWTENKQKH